jgi:hypothetical protein
MSDTEDADDGDDGFDKEAEREKLREKYEAEREQREATQQMSELLLKGATMTDHHCDDCGSPIFRYEGEAFCPMCAGTRDVAEEGGQQAGGQQGGQQAGGQQPGEAGAGGRQPGAGDARRPSAASGGDDERSSATPDDGELDEEELEAARRRLDEQSSSRSPTMGGPSDRRPNPPVGDSPVRQGEVPSMAQTRASLRRAIVSLSEQAAQSDDPNRARDLLQGAREASEALAALEGTTGE